MRKEDAMIILGTAHLGSTPGKCSPDGRLKEAVWSREICKEMCVKLRGTGFKTEIDYEPLNASADMKGATAKIEQNHELAARVNFVNSLCNKHGKVNCLYVSIHVNAAGADGKWHNATGWEAYTSTGVTSADRLAECLYESAKKNLIGKKIRTDFSDKDSDKESNFYVLKHTNCPAVLTENFFQDNKEDVEYLTSDLGFH